MCYSGILNRFAVSYLRTYAFCILLPSCRRMDKINVSCQIYAYIITSTCWKKVMGTSSHGNCLQKSFKLCLSLISSCKKSYSFQRCRFLFLSHSRLPRSICWCCQSIALHWWVAWTFFWLSTSFAGFWNYKVNNDKQNLALSLGIHLGKTRAAATWTAHNRWRKLSTPQPVSRGW